MLMKYKDFKLMTQNEMKNVMGGSAPKTTYCTVVCKMTHTNANYVVPVPECPVTNFPCFPGDELVRDCECQTVGQY